MYLSGIAPHVAGELFIDILSPDKQKRAKCFLEAWNGKQRVLQD